jgi:hypothetical protein
MERIMKALVFAALAAAFFLPLAAFAQDAPPAPSGPPPRVGQACRADFQSFCPNIAPGPQRRECITANMAKMSPGCQAAFNGMRQEMGDVRQACAADIKQYCATATGPARRQCITQNQTQFSTGCQAALAQEHGGGQPPAPPPQQ